MTVSSSVGAEFTIARLVRMAYRQAGLLDVQRSPNTAQMGHALEELELGIKALSAKGVTAHAVTFLNVDLVAGTTRYQLAIAAQGVVGDAMLIPAGQDPDAADGETLVRQIKREEYHTLGSKAATGRPTAFYVDRTTVQPSIVLWPIPSQADTLRLQIHRRLADSQDGNATLDLQEYWWDAVVSDLAWRLAKSHSLPLQRVGTLQGDAIEAFKKARRHANESPPTGVFIAHRAPAGERR